MLVTQPLMPVRDTSVPEAGRDVAIVSIVPATIPSRERKLHLGHFAFMRAVVQGLDTKESWNRYLRLEGEHSDIRRVRRTIQWIRDEFAAASRRLAKPGVARLVQLDAIGIKETEAPRPSLEEFALERGMEDFSHAEQLEAYEETYGTASRRESRRARLIKRQLAALRWLETLVAQPPRSGDAVAAWLHPDLASRLESAGIYTIRQLVERINGIGFRWWRSIPAIGAGKAERVIEWLHVHEPSIGLKIGAHTAIKRSKLYPEELQGLVARGTAIVPIEKFVVPAELNGENGLYRAPQHLCLMRAKNDYEAVLAWIKGKVTPEKRQALKAKSGLDPARPEGPMDWLRYLSNTQRAYLKEAERFLLWAIVQKKKPLSSMTLEDCNDYAVFLADPTPADLWCGARGREKWSPLWRPFEGKLSESAQRYAITVLKSMYKFLVDQCYLVGNPWNGVKAPKPGAKRVNRGRSFTQAQWQFIETQLDMLPNTSANLRLRFALHLFYATGVRLSEGVAAQVDHLDWQSYPPGPDETDAVEGWELTVQGKGDVQRKVPVPQDVIAELSHYLVSRGLDPDPEHPTNKGAYLLGWATDIAERAPWSPLAKQPIAPRAGISASRLYDQLKAFFGDCAKAMTMADHKSAQRMQEASTHWLRHTHGSHSLAAGMDVKILQENMGHASLDTTTGYGTSEESRRMRAVNAVWEKKPRAS